MFEDSALAYARDEGLPVFPLKPRGKTPLTRHGLDDATADLLVIETWWSRHPDANVAIRTGELVVVDEDQDGAFARLCAEHGQPVPDTRRARTGSGRHWYFTQPAGATIRNTAGKLAPGIDTRGTGGYVVAPPSIHPSGATYTWESTVPAVAFPGWLVTLLETREPVRQPMPAIAATPGTTPYGQRALEAETHTVATAAEGTRNDRLNTAAFSLGQLVAGRELDEWDARNALTSAARACGLPALEAQATIDSGLNGGQGSPRSAPENGRPEPRLRVVADIETTVAAQPDPPPIVVETWATFERAATETIPTIIDGLWPEAAFGFIAAPPKKGKTWVGLSVALSVAAGVPALAQFNVPEAKPVIYLALEGHRAAIRGRIGCLARGMGINPDRAGSLDNLHIIYKPRGLNLADALWVQMLQQSFAEIKPALVIVDVLRAAVAMKESSNDEFSALRRALEPLTADNIAIGLLHHFGKLTEITKERTPGERMSGAGAMYGALDVGVFITGSDEGARKLRVEFELRDLATPEPLGLHLAGEPTGVNGGFVYTDTASWEQEEPPDEADVAANADDLIAWLEQQPGRQATTAEIAYGLGASTRTIDRRRQAWIQAGVIWTPHKGNNPASYSLAPITPRHIDTPSRHDQHGAMETDDLQGKLDVPIATRHITPQHPGAMEKSADMQEDSIAPHHDSPTGSSPHADAATAPAYLDELIPDDDREENS